MTQIGLAMARSIGDHAVKSIGVVAEPEVTTHTIAVRQGYGSDSNNRALGNLVGTSFLLAPSAEWFGFFSFRRVG